MENTLGSIVRTARKEKGLTQGVLAKSCGLCTATIALIETGKNPNPSFATLGLLSKHLDLDMKTLQNHCTAIKNRCNESTCDGEPIISPSQSDLELVSLLCNNISKLSEKEKSIIRLLLE